MLTKSTCLERIPTGKKDNVRFVTENERNINVFKTGMRNGRKATGLYVDDRGSYTNCSVKYQLYDADPTNGHKYLNYVNTKTAREILNEGSNENVLLTKTTYHYKRNGEKGIKMNLPKHRWPLISYRKTTEFFFAPDVDLENLRNRKLTEYWGIDELGQSSH